MGKEETPQFLQGTLDLLILRAVAQKSLHGYAIAEVIHRLSDEVLSVEEGSLYPALHRLERDSLIAAKWETSSTNRRARFYRLTPIGRKRLAVERSRWEQMAAAITRVMRPA